MKGKMTPQAASRIQSATARSHGQMGKGSFPARARRKEKERLPEIKRAGRLPWARPFIDHEQAVEVMVWDYDDETPKGKVVRTYIWLKDHDYVVILEQQKKEKGDVFMLVTSFHLDFEGKRHDLQSRYERRRK